MENVNHSQQTSERFQVQIIEAVIQNISCLGDQVLILKDQHFIQYTILRFFYIC